jgi:ribosomal protein S18 acetylase RimI-like enzyme
MKNGTRINVRECNFLDVKDCRALVDLMNQYMADPMGGSLPAFSREKAIALIEGLKKHPAKLILLATWNSEYCGLTNCFINFGTFAARPYINIHDIVVDKRYRGLGIGRALLNEIIIRAQTLNCSKITLEVRDDNKIAKALYSSLGFAENEPVMLFWSKYF